MHVLYYDYSRTRPNLPRSSHPMVSGRFSVAKMTCRMSMQLIKRLHAGIYIQGRPVQYLVHTVCLHCIQRYCCLCRCQCTSFGCTYSLTTGTHNSLIWILQNCCASNSVVPTRGRGNDANRLIRLMRLASTSLAKRSLDSTTY